MKDILYRIGSWLVLRFGPPVEPVEPPVKAQFIPEIDAAVLASATDLVARWEQVAVSGEYKRHAVLADLMKLHPDAEGRVLCLAIELAIWGVA
jgi:hypothetical protein